MPDNTFDGAVAPSFNATPLLLIEADIIFGEEDAIFAADDGYGCPICFYNVLADYFVCMPENGKSILDLVVQLWSQSFASNIFSLLFHKWVCVYSLVEVFFPFNDKCTDRGRILHNMVLYLFKLSLFSCPIFSVISHYRCPTPSMKYLCHSYFIAVSCSIKHFISSCQSLIYTSISQMFEVQFDNPEVLLRYSSALFQGATNVFWYESVPITCIRSN